jgi:CRP-like cAMP-binding protein
MTKHTIGNSLFLDFASTLLSLSAAFNEAVMSDLKLCVVKKGEHLINYGESADYKYFIRKGILRGYIIHNTKEITMWLNSAGEIVATGENILEQSVANESILAIEDCELEVLSKPKFHELIKNHYEMVLLTNTILLYNYQDACFRALISKIPNATERYNYFLSSKYGPLINRVPLKFIASFLGLRNETLSRIRSIHK